METRILEELPTGDIPQKKGKRNTVLLAAAIIAAVMLAAVGWIQLGKGELPWFQAGNSGDEVRHLIPVKEFQVNLADKGARRYVRLRIYLGSNDRPLVKEVERREPELRSNIIAILRSTTVSDLEGKEGMKQLKADILKQVNAQVSTGKVEDIFFDEFIIQ